MWIKTTEKLPKNNEVVLCYIEGEYEVGLYEKAKKRFKHTLGKTSLEFVEAWIPIPVYKEKKEKKEKDAAVLSTTKEAVSKVVTNRRKSKSRRHSVRSKRK